MPENETGDKTEAPTPRRRQEARDEGQIARSTDLTAAVGILAAIVLLQFMGNDLMGSLLDLTREVGRSGEPLAGQLPAWVLQIAARAAVALLPLLLALFVLTVLGAIVQSGPSFTWKKLKPDITNVSVIKGVKRIFSTDSLTKLLLSLLKIALIGAIAYVTIRGMVVGLIGSGLGGIGGAFTYGADAMFTLALRLALVLLILGLGDFAYQKWKLERSLKMSKQEVKDELKRMEGDPMLKQRRRQIAMKLAMQRVGIDVPKSDVVVTNPTEYAVALRYDEDEMAAPRVVAKGKGWLALHIRQVAQQHGVPVVQRPPLARALFAACEPGQEVPSEYYRAVAELLAYVYRITGRAAG